MEKVNLYNAFEEYVCTVEIPPMSPKPEIICWGERFFVLKENGKYIEGIVWVITHPTLVTFDEIRGE